MFAVQRMNHVQQKQVDGAWKGAIAREQWGSGAALSCQKISGIDQRRPFAFVDSEHQGNVHALIGKIRTVFGKLGTGNHGIVLNV